MRNSLMYSGIQRDEVLPYILHRVNGSTPS